jgi:hypothetical protein
MVSYKIQTYTYLNGSRKVMLTNDLIFVKFEKYLIKISGKFNFQNILLV